MANRVTVPVTNFEALSPPWSLTSLDQDLLALQGALNDSSLGYVVSGTDTGSVNNYVIATPSFGTPSAYQVGMTVAFIPANTNTGNSTLTVGALTPQAIMAGASNVPPGMLSVGNAVLVTYIGAAFQLMSVPTVASVPTGTLMDFAGAGSAPPGYLLCDGSAVSRTTYAALFTVLGGASSPWGLGDGSTTFNLPDFRGRAAIGAGTGSGLTNRVLGANGGEENHALVVGEEAVHSHSIGAGQFVHSHNVPAGQFSHTHTDSGHAHPYDYVASTTPGGASPINIVTGPGSGTAILTRFGNAVISTNTLPGGGTDAQGVGAGGTNNAGSGAGHNTMMPFAVVTKIIKT